MKNKSKKYLVVGGAGFIGSNLTDELIRLKHQVFVLDNLSTGKKENINPKAKFIKADIRSLKQITPFFKNIDGVFLLAAMPRVQYSIENPIETNRINIEGILNVLVVSQKAGVKRVVYSASSSAYGNAKKFPTKEDSKAMPLSPYGLQKYVGEEYCRLFSLIHNLETVSLRYFNVYGPRMSDKGAYVTVMSVFLRQLGKNQPLTITGDGEQSRDFCVTGETLILMDNFSWKPIQTIKPGEKIISFDEYPINKKRRFRISRVKAVSSYISPNVYEIRTKKGNIKTTGNHPWLMPKRGYRQTLDLKENMKRYKNQKLRKFSNPIFVSENIFYKKGYIAGSIEGDGYIRFFRYPNKSTSHIVALEVTDKEFRDALHSYFKEIGLNSVLSERQFKYPNSKRTYITRSSRKNDYQKILQIIKNKKLNDKNFCRGYLAGIFDSEGEFDGWQLKISNKDQSIIGNIKKILGKFNFKWSEYNRKDGLLYIKILGGLNEHIRFFSLFRPKITRKRPKMETREVKGELVKIISINKIPATRVYNLEVKKASTYIANGFMCHNTNVSDVVRANILAMNSKKVGKGEVINIGANNNYTINQVAQIFIKHYSKKNPKADLRIEYIAPRIEPHDTLADISLAKKLLAWQPKVKIEDGIKRLLNRPWPSS